jgi:hypothetical protein
MLEMLKGKKTHILVIAAALITAYQNISGGSLDLDSAKQIVELFMVSTIREGMKAIGPSQ